MNIHKTIYTIILLAATCLTLGSCDSKWDENGPLDGMWQLTEWREKASGDILKTNQDDIYYSVQLDIIQFRFGGQGDRYYLAYFTHEGEELQLGKTVLWPTDEVLPHTELAPLGVPADGCFHIDRLDKQHLVLSTPEATLTFRKY